MMLTSLILQPFVVGFLPPLKCFLPPKKTSQNVVLLKILHLVKTGSQPIFLNG